jgi:UDP-N-acetylglucosamine transferase subunit ALG13
MILVTVGTQLPFDRLIRAVDDLAPGLGQHVIAQTNDGAYRPLNLEAHSFFGPDKFATLVRECSTIVSHAGIGSILTARQHAKPIILMPRRADLGEHRNDHQLATCAALADKPGIHIAEGPEDLAALFGRTLAPAADIGADRERLIRSIRDYIAGN